jgi:hypothetical protein
VVQLWDFKWLALLYGKPEAVDMLKATRKDNGSLLVFFCGSADKTKLCSKDIKSKISRGKRTDKAKAKATTSSESQPTTTTSKVTL